MRYIGFLRWWLFVTLFAVGCYFAYDLGAFQDIWEKDATKLSFVIMGIFGFHTIWCGVKTFHLSRQLKHGVLTTKIRDLARFQEIGWFASEACLNIGMIGTVIGFIMMLVGFTDVDTTSVEKIQDLLGGMSGGMSTALYTTLVGLICSQALKVEYFNLTHGLNKAVDELPETDDGPLDVEAELIRKKNLLANQKKVAAAKKQLEAAQEELLALTAQEKPIDPRRKLKE